jgi:hypothetical protein
VAEASAREQLDSAARLYLRELSEPAATSLLLVVEETTAENTRTFGLIWKQYAAYFATEESVVAGAGGEFEDEVYTGRMLRVYSKSRFLDLVQATGGEGARLEHYKLICINRLIDVASDSPPEIRILIP